MGSSQMVTMQGKMVLWRDGPHNWSTLLSTETDDCLVWPATTAGRS